MSEPQVTYARDGHVAVLTMNRPEAMNAMSVAMLTDLTDAVRWAMRHRRPRIRL